MALYSASAEERETTACFFDRHEMSDCPRKIQKPVTERRESGQDAQSESEYARRVRDEREEKRRPYLGAFFIYRRT